MPEFERVYNLLIWVIVLQAITIVLVIIAHAV
jgi:hypothetical protein